MSYEPPEDESRGVPPTPPEGSASYGFGTPTRPVGDIMGAPGATPAEGGLIDSYRRVVLSPSVEVFESEIPRASWSKTLVGVAAVLVTTALVGLFTTYVLVPLLPDIYSPTEQLESFRERLQNEGIDTGRFGWLFELPLFLVGSRRWILSLVLTPILFLMGAGALYLSARVLGGRGRSFMTHSYLLSLSYTPLRVISGLLIVVPLIGELLWIAAFFYQLYIAGLSIQASQRMEPGKAMMAAFIPLIVTLLLLCVGVIVIAFVLASMLRPR